MTLIWIVLLALTIVNAWCWVMLARFERKLDRLTLLLAQRDRRVLTAVYPTHMGSGEWDNGNEDHPRH